MFKVVSIIAAVFILIPIIIAAVAMKKIKKHEKSFFSRAKEELEKKLKNEAQNLGESYKKCVYCGSRVKNEDSVCPSCGANITE